MRLSNNLMFRNNLNTILSNQEEVNRAQQQVNTQKRVLTASDDPSAIANSMLYTDKIQSNEQYAKSSSMLSSRLEMEESVLENIKGAISKAQVLTIQAGNGALSDSDREGLSAEINSLKESIFELMNSKSEDGGYIFAGYQDSKQAFVYDSGAGKYVYQGDQGQHSIKVAEGISIKSSDNGFNVFEKASKRLDVDKTTIVPATSKVYVQQQGAFDNFHKANYNADPTAPANANTVTINFTSATTYDLQVGGTTIQSGTYQGNKVSVNGMDITFTGTPASIDFDLEAPAKQNVLNTLDDLVAILNTPNLDQNDYKQALADANVGLDNAKNLVSQTQSVLGGRLNTTKRIEAANSDLDINNKLSKANLVELDMAEAITELTKHETALQASQATFGRLSSLSLLDYIR
ncbi:flagellar hook-associated protein FlgL [Pseudoalteromonas sp. S16_S37]|uniref:flagellar hook-associated protein FlgL n=1 Tax=Pseudoalteromonas sp. S16_S37 TaxID=2720228 RepID=UPI0016807705|nr:flagellar hook-associated protein FlgL [Pseudoalteromonas sp. S16_S37]MBD1582200.1 flagellar hook-associated protein FlgL [Pseudoalteromonas sp. S16_S37]